MPTEEYYKARFTGVADMSKPGAADGLIAHDRTKMNNISIHHAAPIDREETIKAGYSLGYFFGLLLPYLFVLFGGWVVFYKVGIKMGLGTNAETFPTWYAFFSIFVPPLAAFMLRKIIGHVFFLFLLVWLGYAVIF